MKFQFIFLITSAFKFRNRYLMRLFVHLSHQSRRHISTISYIIQHIFEKIYCFYHYFIHGLQKYKKRLELSAQYKNIPTPFPPSL